MKAPPERPVDRIRRALRPRWVEQVNMRVDDRDGGWSLRYLIGRLWPRSWRSRGQRADSGHFRQKPPARSLIQHSTFNIHQLLGPRVRIDSGIRTSADRAGPLIDDDRGERPHGPRSGGTLRKLVAFGRKSCLHRLRNAGFDQRSPGYMVCGNGEAGKLRVAQRGASIAC